MSIPLHHQLRSVPDTDAEKISEIDAPADLSQSESSAGQATAADAPRTGGAQASGVRRRRWRRSSVWREQVRSRLADLAVELDSLPPHAECDEWREDARERLNEAETIIGRKPSLLGAWTGIDIEATWMRIHAIEVALVRLSTPEIIRAKLPGIIDDGSHLLGEEHPRVKILRAYQKRPDWDEDERECLAHSIRAVYEASDKENVRLRSFRNVLLGATFALAILAILFAIFGAVNPSAIDVLTTSSSSGSSVHSSPSRTEILVIEMLGLISATLVGAVAIRHIQGTSAAYSVPMASLLLKLPTGALTALAGILMIRAGIVPGVQFASDHLGGYALLFGASQQGFTGLVDRQAHNVLNSVSSKDNA
jgi:hypothetical protein